MEVQTTERPATEAWAEEHPIRHARLVDQIAAKYPIGDAWSGRVDTDYCIWGAVSMYLGWPVEPGDVEGWPMSSRAVRERANTPLLHPYEAMHAHDSGRPSAEVWNLVDEALRAAGLC